MRVPAGLIALGLLVLGAALWFLTYRGEAGGVGMVTTAPETAAPVLGPADGHELPPTQIDRVAIGTEAPDFTLESYSGDLLTLSDYRGSHNVILVFYRGHW